MSFVIYSPSSGMETGTSNETLDESKLPANGAEGSTLEKGKKKIEAMERDEVMGLLDNIDNRVEALRKEALKMQEERDKILTQIFLLKNPNWLTNLSDSDYADVSLHLKRIKARLQTVDINVQTVRDHSQIDSLNIINHLIDEVIRFSDPIAKRQRCQQCFNACCVKFQCTFELDDDQGPTQITFIDKKFETQLLGCTLDDQKRIKKRLEALLNYLAQQIIIAD